MTNILINHWSRRESFREHYIGALLTKMTAFKLMVRMAGIVITSTRKFGHSQLTQNLSGTKSGATIKADMLYRYTKERMELDPCLVRF